LQNRGLFRRITDLNELDRLHQTVRQQQIKVNVLEVQTKAAIYRVQEICGEIIKESFDREVQLKSKIETIEKWNKVFFSNI
jgi:hypothetical protein